MSYFLGLDIGTSAAKALLVDEAGQHIASASEEYPLSTPRPLWAEQDPRHWREGCYRAIRRLLIDSEVSPEAIACIGLSGQMHGSVFLDRQGEILRPAILWCDQRTQSQCDYLTRTVGRDNLGQLIGNAVLTGFTAPKILWVRENEPEIYSQITQVLLPKDYLRYCLTGKYATEVSDASGTALFDVAHRRWSPEMLEAADIPLAWMPECAESIVITGKVSAQAAGETGLKEGTPVVGGGGDQAAGAVGCGAVVPGTVSSVVGTSGVVYAPTEKPLIDSQLRAHTFCSALPGQWHVMGVTLSAGGSLRWLRDCFFQSETAVGAETGVDPYELMALCADTAPPGSEGLVFLPYLSGERTPHPDPNARGVYFGITLRHGRAHFARALMEGVSYSLLDCFALLREMQVPIQVVRASGGGARSAIWNQIHADVTGQTHWTLSVEEGPALGAALLAATGAGCFSTVEAACARAVTVKEAFHPRAENAAAYESGYALYRSLYPALKTAFDHSGH